MRKGSDIVWLLDEKTDYSHTIFYFGRLYKALIFLQPLSSFVRSMYIRTI